MKKRSIDRMVIVGCSLVLVFEVVLILAGYRAWVFSCSGLSMAAVCVFGIRIAQEELKRG